VGSGTEEGEGFCKGRIENVRVREVNTFFNNETGGAFYRVSKITDFVFKVCRKVTADTEGGVNAPEKKNKENVKGSTW